MPKNVCRAAYADIVSCECESSDGRVRTETRRRSGKLTESMNTLD